MMRVRVEFLDGEVSYYRVDNAQMGNLNEEARILSLGTVEGPVVSINVDVVRLWTVEEWTE